MAPLERKLTSWDTQFRCTAKRRVRVGDGSVRIPTKTLSETSRKFDATVTGVKHFDYHEKKYGW
jgi:hypothetical protein